MNKQFHNYTKCLVASVVLAFGFAACTDDNGIADLVPNNEPCIELILSADDLSTRTVTGENSTGSTTQEFLDPEKAMKTVDVFFYANNAEDTAPALYHHHIDNTSHGKTETIKLDNSLKDILFGNGNTCKAYAVVNVTDGVLKAGATLAELRAIKAKTPTFATEFDGFAMFTKESGGDVVTYNEGDRKATGTLKVRNLAAKIDLFVSFGSGETKTVSGVDPNNPGTKAKNWNAWNPANTRKDGEGTQKGSAEVYLVNGSTVVPLKGWETSDFDGTKIPEYIGNDEYFDLRNDNGKYSHRLDVVTESTKAPVGSEYYTECALYSYPNQWTTDIVEQHQTYLMLKVNWLPDDIQDEQENVESDLVETYYKIPINLTGDSENRLLHNRYYRVKVNINTLGGQNFGEPVELEASCEVLPWGGTKLNADIFSVRYLEVTQLQKDPYMADPERSEYQAIMQNTNIAYIPYNSSHKIKVSYAGMQFWNFKTGNYIPKKVGILSRRDDGKDLVENNGPDGKGELDVNALLLDQAKFDWYEKEGKEPNGIVIDEENSRIVLYKSVYSLAGYEHKDHPDVPESGLYVSMGDKTYSPFFITLKIEHVDDPTEFEYINILQYPGVYVTYTYNDGKNAEGTSIGRRAPDGRGSNSEPNGYRLGVYINGGATATWSSYSESDGSNALQMGGIGGRTRTDNHNMYSIHVSQLSDDDIMRDVKFGHANLEETRDVQFHIGDPRTKFVNRYLAGDLDLTDTEDLRLWGNSSYTATNLNSRSNFTKVPATAASGGAQRLYHKEESTLRYYYPTNEGQEDVHAFMIAPVFRMSSGATDVFTGTTTIGLNRDADRLSRETARRRCAALQENGYPAGRWRLPTIGEMLFFRMLQKKNVLPEIFGKDGKDYRSHWTAQYMMKFDKEESGVTLDVRKYEANDSQDHKWVRCVYDDWYWVKDDGSADIITANDDRIDITGGYASYYGDNDKRTMFVWGDKLKNNPQDQP